jgi:ribosomal protein S6--L-glutamate ligase
MTVPRIGFLLPKYSRHSTSLMPLVVQALEDRGAVADVLHPVDRPCDLSQVRVEHDLYVLRKMSGLALSLAGALHELGATIVNTYSATATLRDKIVTTRILQNAGVPTPATYVASRREHLVPLLDEGSLVVKPYQGAGGHHVTVVRTAAELESVDWDGREPLFAQRHLAHDGRDRKIYAIGDRLWGVKKVFPRRTEADKRGEPFTLTPELRDIALRCGRAFGVELYGVDVIESDGEPYVVDVGTAPGYEGVPDAPRLVAEHLYAAAQRATRGESLEAVLG